MACANTRRTKGMLNLQAFNIRHLIAPCILVVSACSQDMSDLEQYIDETNARPGIEVPPLPEVKPYVPKSYLTGELRNPFSSYEDWERANEPPEVSALGPKPVQGRFKEPLEAFPLDGMRMVGLLEIDNSRYALVKSPEPLVYRVQVGDYMGQNHGQIIKVTESEVILSELVLNGIGGWDERQSSIAMSESESN